MSSTISDFLRETSAYLYARGIESARLDALLFVCDQLGRDKAWVLAHQEYELQGSDVEILNTKIAQRATHVPLAYLRGTVEFYSRNYIVNKHVLVPRPESEALIELVKQVANDKPQVTIIDIGTGSGALAITAKLELPSSIVLATDIDPACLSIAKHNALALAADVTFLKSDLLRDLENSKFKVQNSIIIANLPYVPKDYPINQAVSHEPAQALFSGVDGLSHYRALFAQLKNHAFPALYVITESLLGQHQQTIEIAKKSGYKHLATDGLGQLFVRYPSK
ncbi:MAG: peptide chain release factor N(5)-glutamine methyltransferase [Candidatus Saccharimonadales bacterium]